MKYPFFDPLELAAIARDGLNVFEGVALSISISYAVPMNTPLKEQAQRLLETLPEDATWEDLQYAIYIHQAVAAGQADIDAGRVYTSEEVRQKFNLPPRA